MALHGLYIYIIGRMASAIQIKQTYKLIQAFEIFQFQRLIFTLWDISWSLVIEVVGKSKKNSINKCMPIFISLKIFYSISY